MTSRHINKRTWNLEIRPRVFFGLVLCLSLVDLNAQSVPRLRKVADELFKNSRFLDATEYYEKIVSLDKRKELFEARYRLGICYVESLRYAEAEKVFEELGKIDKQENDYRAKAIYRHASILKVDASFEEADSLFAQVISMSSDQELIKLSRKQKEGCLLALRQSKKDRGFSVTSLDDVNSKYHDFGAVINPSNGQLVLATTRNLGGVQFEGTQVEGVLPDLASFEKSRERWRLNSNDQRFDRLNSEWSEGAGSFAQDGNRFYFSTCEGDGSEGCKIMVSNLENGRWSKAEPLNEYINEKGTDSKQPFISVTGDTLFFSSNRAGGYGGSDIWMSLKGLAPESWSPAINMGDAINSAEEDITPYYSSAFKCLIFASNGHVGYGGFDLYAAKGVSFFEPEIYNLGAPFNSSLDDTYFNISSNLGFLSSNRADGRLLNLYSFDVTDESLFLSLLISGESLIDGKVVSRFRNTRTLDLFAFRVEDYQGYELFAPEKRIKPKPSVIAKREAKQKNTLPALQNGQSLASYQEDDGPESYFKTASTGRRSSYQVDYEHLYFRSGSFELQPSAIQSLDELVAQLNGLNISSIEILAYTDIDGSKDFNQQLSSRRGNEIAKYLMASGVSENLIQVRARGEGPLSSRNSWYAKMFSRRAEIIVNAETPLQLRRSKPYAVRYKKTLEELGQLLGIAPSTLRKSNNRITGIVEPGTIIRIPEDLVVIPNIRFFLEEKDMRNTFFMYHVKQNETLSTVASRYQIPEELIAEINQLEGELEAGDQIFIYRIE
ncbi:MAG: OmpA family protein [Bacteroidota bacterium]